MDYLNENWRNILEIALQVLGAASIIARLTPTDSDDKAIQWLLNLIHNFGLTKPSSTK